MALVSESISSLSLNFSDPALLDSIPDDFKIFSFWIQSLSLDDLLLIERHLIQAGILPEQINVEVYSPGNSSRQYARLKSKLSKPFDGKSSKHLGRVNGRRHNEALKQFWNRQKLEEVKRQIKKIQAQTKGE